MPNVASEPFRAFVCRVTPRTVKKDKPRGTLIPNTIALDDINPYEEFPQYFADTIARRDIPDPLNLEFGQPPAKDGQVEIQPGDVIVLLVGSDDPDGSDSPRGIIGLAEVRIVALRGYGPSARAVVSTRPIVKLADYLTNKFILRSSLYEDSGLDDIKIFGFESNPQAHNCVRFYSPQSDSPQERKRLWALLRILQQFDGSVDDQLRRNKPVLADLLCEKFDEFFDEPELVNGESTGVAKELETEEEIFSNPYDPNLIRVDGKMFSLKNIVDMLNDGDLELAPDFQRNRVWKSIQKCRLIESILLRIPLPAFYFSTAQDGTFSVVDGLQRLSTISEFMMGDGFRLETTYLEYLQNEVGGKTFSEIEGTIWGRRMKTTQILVNVIDPQTPEKVKFDIFKRINTGGSPLEPQEIRHCMSGPLSRALLFDCANSEEFKKATGCALLNHPRMVDREFVLRFMAFKLMRDLKEYMSAGSMDAFLTEATRKLDFDVGPEKQDSLRREFIQAMENAYFLFGRYAFRKWPLGAKRVSPINRALFETWAVTLSSCAVNDLTPVRGALVKEARTLMTNDFVFLDAISTATGSPAKVESRFKKVHTLVSAYIS